MSDAQLYLAVGLPSVVALMGILMNLGYFIVINQRLTSVETRLAAVEASNAVLKQGFDIILKKLEESHR